MDGLSRDKKPGKLKSFFIYLRCVKPLLVSHHPNCEKFAENHTLNIGKNRFCIGCFVGYPTLIIGIIIIFLLNLVEIFDSLFFLIISVILTSTFVLGPLNLTKIKVIKITQKILVCTGLAFLYWYIWSLPYSFLTNFIYLFLVFGFLFFLLNVYQGYSVHKVCKRCEYSLNWRNCPGFKQIFECFEKYNSKYLLKFHKNK